MNDLNPIQSQSNPINPNRVYNITGIFVSHTEDHGIRLTVRDMTDLDAKNRIQLRVSSCGDGVAHCHTMFGIGDSIKIDASASRVTDEKCRIVKLPLSGIMVVDRKKVNQRIGTVSHGLKRVGMSGVYRGGAPVEAKVVLDDEYGDSQEVAVDPKLDVSGVGLSHEAIVGLVDDNQCVVGFKWRNMWQGS